MMFIVVVDRIIVIMESEINPLGSFAVPKFIISFVWTGWNMSTSPLTITKIKTASKYHTITLVAHF